MELSVTVIIPVWNGRDLLIGLLDTLQAQTISPAEILIIDNGSEDGAPEAAERRGARVIRLGRNMGFAHAVNFGILQSTSSHVAILNSDVELDAAWLETLLAARAPFACGKILSAANHALLDGTYDLVCRGGCPWRAGHHAADSFETAARTIDLASFTAVLIKREIFSKIGLLDERFESYLEDVDFGLRCVVQGIQGRYVPAAVCRHHGSSTLGRWHGESVRRMARNQVFLIAKHYPHALARRWWWPILVAQCLWGLLALRHGAGWKWMRGKYEGLLLFRTFHSAPPPTLEATLQAHEAAIYQLQNRQGMDWYWRVYFALAGEKRHRLNNE